MRILIVKPGKKPEVKDIAGTLESMQEIVGGKIEAVYPFEEPVALVLNDEGKLLELPMNRELRSIDGEIYDIICGTFLVVGLSEDSFASLTDEQVERFTQALSVPKLFIKAGCSLLVLPMEGGDGDEG